LKRFFLIVTLIILVGLGILYLTLKMPDAQKEISDLDNSNFCGTNAFSTETSFEGRQIFNTNCAACHKLDQKMMGPPLRHISKKYDTLTILNFLHGEKTKIVNEDYEDTCINFPQLTKEDISLLLSYTN
jgi:cytochrome c551/c552